MIKKYTKQSLIITIIFTFVLALFTLTSCEKSDDENISNTTSIEIKNLAADTIVRINFVNNQPIPITSGVPVLFRFEDSAKVDLNDSLTDKWDLGFKTGSRGDCIFYLNSAKEATGYLYNKAYSEITELPSDSTFKKDASPGSIFFSDWYSYNPRTHTIAPKPGVSFIINTTKGQKVKLEMLSIYKDGVTPTNSEDVFTKSYFYSFRYTIQKNTSLNTFN